MVTAALPAGKVGMVVKVFKVVKDYRQSHNSLYLEEVPQKRKCKVTKKCKKYR